VSDEVGGGGFDAGGDPKEKADGTQSGERVLSKGGKVGGKEGRGGDGLTNLVEGEKRVLD